MYSFRKSSKNCRQLILFVTFLLLFFNLPAQLGLTVGTDKLHALNWEIVTDNYITNGRQDFLKYGTSLGVDYKLPLKTSTVKFYPTLLATRFTSTLIHFEDQLPYEFNLVMVGIHLKANIYPFLLSKGISAERSKWTFQENLFFQISPSINLISQQNTYPNFGEPLSSQQQSNNQWKFNMAGGLGFNLQLSELLTLSPFLGVRYFRHLEWKNLTKITTRNMKVNQYDNGNVLIWDLNIRIEFQLKNIQ